MVVYTRRASIPRLARHKHAALPSELQVFKAKRAARIVYGTYVMCVKQMSRRLSSEKVHGRLEKHLEQHIEEQMHYNRFEHREKPWLFMGRIIFYGLLGVIGGAVVEAIITRVPNDGTSQVRCGLLIGLHLAVIAGVFLAASLVFGAGIDNWVMETWAGFMFGITFFTSQQSLTTNALCTFNLD